MKSVLAILGCLLATIGIAAAQGISAQLTLEQEQYLPGETLTATVRIANDSGQPVTFGKDNNWLTFAVEDTHHFVVHTLSPVPVQGEFTLETSTAGKKRVDLAPYYDLTRIGRYTVTATVNIPQWNGVVQSKAVSFDIIRGSSIWDKDFGMPTADQQRDGPPEMRRYSLVQTLHSKTLKLYLRLTDTREVKIFKIYPLGQMVSFGNLEPQLDKFSNLHVLFQTGGRVFTHCLVTPDGVLLARENYENSDTRPKLRLESDGRITVAGGIRRVSASDLPPPSNLNAAADTNTSQK